ncbi:AAA family ATPase [Sphaerisporangium sp. NPDC051011]|uniref:AAA family ATPase n=1 Tax=Sphaerisporangium sp. NPDC051011 TaxID=3155792 RepID=UPI0033FDF407
MSAPRWVNSAVTGRPGSSGERVPGGPLGVRGRAGRGRALDQAATDVGALPSVHVEDLAGLDRPDVHAADLSYGQQKLLGLAVALSTRPAVLCLDEPLAGVSPATVDLLLDVVRDIRAAGVALLLVEHNIEFVREVSDRVTVLAAGAVVAGGTPDILDGDKLVFETLMGNA